MFYVINLKKYKKLMLFLVLGALLVIATIVGINIRYPIKYLDIIIKYASENELAPAFVCAVIHAESRFDYKAESHKNAKGLMQLTKPTADWLAEEIDIYGYNYESIHEPELNISIGSYYLKKLLIQYNNDVNLALAAYNAGSGNVAKWLQNSEYSSNGELVYIPFAETRNYIEKVNRNYKIYKILLRLKR